jgi:anti-sigma regulatory factor (Ser/Thr protein kinase)
MTQIRRPARLESLEDLMAFVTDCAEGRGFRPRRIQEIQLAVEEALVNIFNYAYPENRDGEVRILCEPGDEDRLLVEFRDKGIPYTFEDLGDPDVSAPVADREIGGLGVLLIRKMVDDVRFRREGDENILTFILEPRDPGAEPAPVQPA